MNIVNHIQAYIQSKNTLYTVQCSMYNVQCSVNDYK